MLQRQPRVGDIVDDYCPRERRVSDHAVVAMVGEGIRQTRCTTCDTEHEYREAKVPPSRKKASPVLPPKPPSSLMSTTVPKPPENGPALGDDPVATQAGPAGLEGEPLDGSLPADHPAEPVHEGSVHRRLIRAVLPRVEGETPTRQAPEFTMHRAGANPLTHGQPHHRGPGGPHRQGDELRPRGGQPMGGPPSNRAGHASHSRPGGPHRNAPGNLSGTRGGRGVPGGQPGQPGPGGGPHGRHHGGHGRRQKP
jgi:hypothetical protein